MATKTTLLLLRRDRVDGNANIGELEVESVDNVKYHTSQSVPEKTPLTRRYQRE